MKKCLQCGKEISGKAIYCNDACRMAFKRSQPEQNQPEHPKDPEQMTPNIQPEQSVEKER